MSSVPLAFAVWLLHAFPSGRLLPSEKIAIAVAVTFAPQAFDAHGNWTNSSDPIFRAIGAYLAPKDAPPAAAS
jgi:hypothetical protein